MKMVFAAAVLALGVSTPVLAVEQLVNGTFEAPVINTVPGNKGSFAYPNGTFNGWTYQGAGLINGVTGKPWFDTNRRTGYGGDQYAFVQGAGILSQTFTATADGFLNLSWLEGSRPTRNGSSYDGLQTYNVLLNGVSFGQFSTPNAQNFVAESLFLRRVWAGQSYTLAFDGLAATDSTVFIDNVSAILTPVPEPASWAMLIAGFGLVGLASRRRRRMSVVA